MSATKGRGQRIVPSPRFPRRRRKSTPLFIEALEPRTLLALITWAVDSDGNWDDPTKWSSGKVPTYVDDVVIDRGAVKVNITVRQDQQALSLTSAGNLIVSAGVLRLSAPSLVTGSLTLGPGSLSLDKSLTASGNTNWTGGGISGTFINTGTMVLSGPAVKDLSGELDNTGRITQSGGNLGLTTSTGVINKAGGVYELSGTTIIGDGPSIGSIFGGIFENQGTLEKTGSGQAQFIGSQLNFRETVGTIDVEGGTLSISGIPFAGTGGATIHTAAGAVFDLSPSSSSSFSGTYLGDGGGGMVQISGTIFGDRTNAATLNFAPGQLHFGSGSLQGHLINVGALAIDGPSAKNLSGELDNTGRIIQSGGTFGLTASIGLINKPAGLYELSGTTIIGDGPSIGTIFGGPFENQGKVLKTGGGIAQFLGTQLLFVMTGGTISAQDGRLSIGDGVTVHGTGETLETAPGGEIDLAPSDFSSFSGTYSGTAAGGIIQLSGDFVSDNTSPPVLNFPEGELHWGSGRTTYNLVNAGSLTIEGSFDKAVVNGTLTNKGHIIQTGSGNLVLTGSGQGSFLINETGSLYELNGTGGINTGTFDNKGIFRSTTTNRNALANGLFLFDGGTIDVRSGTLGFPLNVSAGTGETFLVVPGATVDIAGDYFKYYAGTFTGSGGGNVVLHGPFLSDPTTPANLNFPAGMFDVTNTEKLTFLQGPLVNTGVMTFPADIGIGLKGVLANKGTIVDQGAGLSNAGATLINQGLYDLQGDGGIGYNSSSAGGGNLTNTGTIRKSAGIGVSPLDNNQFDNQGVVEALTGTLRIPRNLVQLTGNTLTGGTYRVADGATLDIPQVASITTNKAVIELTGPRSAFPQTANLSANSGTFQLLDGRTFVTSGNFSNSGTLTTGVGSTLVVTGDLTLDNAGTLKVQVGGRPMSAKFGSVKTTGTAAFGGTLAVSLVNGFGPTSGDAYTVLSQQTHTGSFSAITGLDPFFTAQVSDKLVILTTTSTGPDLAISGTEIVAPTSARTGEMVPISFTVRNLNASPAAGDWIDAVYLATGTTLDADSVLLGRVPHKGGVDPLGSYKGSFLAAWPGVAEAAYHVVVVVDSRGIVPDTNRVNNTAASGQTVSSSIQLLALNTPTTGSVDPGADAYYRIDVGAGHDVLVLKQA